MANKTMHDIAIAKKMALISLILGSVSFVGFVVLAVVMLV